MKCFHPLKAYTLEGGGITFNGNQKGLLHDIQLPCGQCIGCREKRSAAWQIRIYHESQLHDFKAFLTLTYTNGTVPEMGLEHRHIQLFLKRLRARLRLPIKYYVCGEYGETTQRPHYHMILLGWDYNPDKRYYKKSHKGFPMYDSEQLNRDWQLGHCTIQDLTPETVGYCTGYLMEDQRKIPPHLTPPYAEMSNGMGAQWLERYHRDLYPHNFAELRGKKRPIPRYYKERLAKLPYNHTEIEAVMLDQLDQHSADNTPDRLAVQEFVAKARQTAKQRNHFHDDAS